MQTIVKNDALKNLRLALVAAGLQRCFLIVLKHSLRLHSLLYKLGKGSLKSLTEKVILCALLSIAPYALAASLGEVAQNAAGNLEALGSAAQVFFGLCGLILIGASIFILIKYNKTEGRGVKLSTAFVYLIGGGLLFYVASLIQTTGDTVWGTGGGDRTHVKIQRPGG